MVKIREGAQERKMFKTHTYPNTNTFEHTNVRRDTTKKAINNKTLSSAVRLMEEAITWSNRWLSVC